MATTKTKIKSFNLTHPEKKEDEVFFSNADDDFYRDINFKTKRYGLVAYNNKGKKYGTFNKGDFPVFVKKSEILELQGAEALRKLEKGE